MPRPKPILINPSKELYNAIREDARIEKRKMGPMVILLLERYYAGQKEEPEHASAK